MPGPPHVGLERRQREVEIEAPCIVDDHGDRVTDLGVRPIVERQVWSGGVALEVDQLCRLEEGSVEPAVLERGALTMLDAARLGRPVERVHDSDIFAAQQGRKQIRPQPTRRTGQQNDLVMMRPP